LSDCGLPDSVTNGQYSLGEQNRTTVNSTAVYNCDEGYQLMKEGEMLTCNLTGQWDKPTPACTGTNVLCCLDV